jgi:hypothetical protein
MEDNNVFMDCLNDELLERIKYHKGDREFENGYVPWKDIAIVLARFRTPFVHDSDCGVRNEPAEPNTECNCKLSVLNDL